MEKTLFISDLHIKSMQETKAQIFLRFLVSAQPQAAQTTLFLVGDIFDLWLGAHSYFVKRYQPLVDEIKKFIAAGGKIYYFEGNHDLHLTRFYQEALGAQVYTEPEIFLFGHQVIRVEHGDEMDTSDKGYLFLRWFLRSWLLKTLILNLPGFLIAKIGDWASRTSRGYSDEHRNAEYILEVLHNHAIITHKKQPFDAIVTGHIHLRDEYHFQDSGKNVISFNLGCWDEKPIALQLEDGKWTWIDLI